jgi:hypothetical protein
MVPGVFGGPRATIGGYGADGIIQKVGEKKSRNKGTI